MDSNIESLQVRVKRLEDGDHQDHHDRVKCIEDYTITLTARVVILEDKSKMLTSLMDQKLAALRSRTQ